MLFFSLNAIPFFLSAAIIFYCEKALQHSIRFGVGNLKFFDLSHYCQYSIWMFFPLCDVNTHKSFPSPSIWYVECMPIIVNNFFSSKCEIDFKYIKKSPRKMVAIVADGVAAHFILFVCQFSFSNLIRILTHTHKR